MILAELRSPVAVMAIVVALLMVYPGDNPAYGQAGGSEARDLFARDKVLEVELEMAEADWNLLRSEGRNLTDIFSGCFSSRLHLHTFSRRSIDRRRARLRCRRAQEGVSRVLIGSQAVAEAGFRP